MKRAAIIFAGFLVVLVIIILSVRRIDKQTEAVLSSHPFAVLLIEQSRDARPLDKSRSAAIAGGAWNTSIQINERHLDETKLNVFSNEQILYAMQTISKRCRDCLGHFTDPRANMVYLLSVVASKTANKPESHHRVMTAEVFILKTLLEDGQFLKKALNETEASENPKSLPFTSSLAFVGEVLPQKEKEARFLRAGLAICERDQQKAFTGLWESSLSGNLSDDDSRIQYILSLGLKDEFVRQHYKKLSPAIKGISH